MNTQFSCWRYIQQPLGIFEPDGKKLLEEHLANKMNYDEFSKRTVRLWKGLKISDLEQIVENIPLRDGSIETLEFFRDSGLKVSCVSSGFDIWRTVFQKKFGFEFDDYLANHIIVDANGVLTGEIDVNVTDDTPLKNKGEQLKKLCGKYNIGSEEVVMIGDGLGDIKAFELAGLSVAVNPTHVEVSEAADYTIDGHSLTGIIEIFKKMHNNPEKITGKEMRF